MMENNTNTAIRLQGVKKKYCLGTIGGRTLQRDLQSWWAKKRGKEDPNLMIGVNAERLGEEFWALDGIDLTIYQGEAVGIIGANGAGKSTLLKIISQITAPTEGEIDIYGRITSMLEVGTGFHGEMTGKENIYMNGTILGMTRSEIDARLDDIIEFSEIGDFINTPVKRYSSGMFVKLAFAVAAHLNSEIMIMDEVLAVGDMAFQKKCLDKMRESAEVDGRTVLYVSHNMNTIRRLCKRVIVLDKGKVIFDGEVEEGIAMYMDHSLGENQTCMDLTTKSHNSVGPNTGLTMEQLVLCDKVTPVYDSGENLDMDIRINVTRAFKNVVYRLTLRTDTDAGLGTSFSQPIDLEPGVQTLHVTIPLDSISRGVFYASIGFYRQDEIGQMFLLDHITRAFKIELPGSPIWSTNAYGYVALPQGEISKV